MGRQLMSLVLILIIALAAAWQFYDMQQREQAMRLRLQALESSVNEMQQRLGTLEGQVTQLRESSVEGLVNEANTAILEGWESLVDTVENELKKAREALRNETFPPRDDAEPAPGQPDDNAPRLESPDGTDRT